VERLGVRGAQAGIAGAQMGLINKELHELLHKLGRKTNELQTANKQVMELSKSVDAMRSQLSAANQNVITLAGKLDNASRLEDTLRLQLDTAQKTIDEIKSAPVKTPKGRIIDHDDLTILDELMDHQLQPAPAPAPATEIDKSNTQGASAD